MRRFLAGILFLLIIPTSVPAQFKGEVESIGFGSFYRPNCFVPMLVRIQSQTSGTYQLQVVQEDLDRDLQIFTQTISLTGAEEGRGGEQRFWMYFVPEPTAGGLPDPQDGLRILQQRLKVFLCDEKGTKQLAQLRITNTISNIESERAGFDVTRGVRMILAVSDATQPVYHDYRTAIGTMENVVFVPIRSSALPEDVRGYEMIDGIIWLSAPLPDPRRPSDEKRFKAIQDYVRGGGHLIVCQPAQRDATAPVAELLPVNVLAVEPRDDLEPLRSIATRGQTAAPSPAEAPNADASLGEAQPRRRTDDWRLPTGPFMFARAEPKRGAIVDATMLKWPDGSESPYIARHAYGLGCVTWVAHDLADPSITNRAKSGWPYVWDHVLDYKHDLTVVVDETPHAIQQLYAGMPGVDLSRPLIDAMRLSAKSRTLISIAVVFFIAYWAIAGPGVYFYLVTRTRPQLSWFLFAFSAVAATMLTVVVVKLVVRGPPEMAHVTVVRGGAGMPQTSITRMGVYIPRDGPQEFELPEIAPRQVSYLTADQRHPVHSATDIEFPAQQRYFIAIHDTTEETPLSVTVPFRSTAKDFTAKRIGPAGGGIEGAAKLRETAARSAIEGKITNGTEHRLRNVYLIYHDPFPGASHDVVFYLPALEKSQTLDLSELNQGVKMFGPRESPTTAHPRDNIRLRGIIGNPGIPPDWAWTKYWFESTRVDHMGEVQWRDLPRALPMLSVFGRLPPLRNGWREGSADKVDRFEVLRRGGRYLDCSNVIAAGQMLVLAEADENGKQPLPYPLKVEGDAVEGKGVIYYQYAIPLERIPAPAPAPAPPATTQPQSPDNPNTTQPAVTAKVEK